jgi:hypothetical protein
MVVVLLLAVASNADVLMETAVTFDETNGYIPEDGLAAIIRRATEGGTIVSARIPQIQTCVPANKLVFEFASPNQLSVINFDEPMP